MGSNAITTITIGLGLMVVAVYFATDSSRYLQTVVTTIGIAENDYVKSVLNFLTPSEEVEKTVAPKNSDSSQPLFTAEQLKKFDGGAESKGLYLAILGEVFDVEKGAQHYKPGGGYAFFAGRDATRAYITGDFTEAGLIDDVSDFEAASLASLEDWLGFYKEEYKYVGKVVGRYYDQNGQPTKELLSIKEKMNTVQKNKYQDEVDKQTFPPCNSEWSKEKGSKVWCSKKSGGVDRSWVGVPRELHVEGRDPRCVCIKNFGPPSLGQDTKKNRGDLDHPGLKEYPGCPESSETCSVSHP
ncbi:hypothetical protein JTE90_019372 [Oedothorax gibbosus]|uniref:Cytochrome b5 heme-binding domain-containing protein n=1 Tax=Oedothorax gibbosus TaxID=931172 RepID=A0AAV6TL89_9ARAC|nr:hypothetical protein JTE90_019372 [Oedothorax gibbosus]